MTHRARAAPGGVTSSCQDAREFICDGGGSGGGAGGDRPLQVWAYLTSGYSDDKIGGAGNLTEVFRRRCGTCPYTALLRSSLTTNPPSSLRRVTLLEPDMRRKPAEGGGGSHATPEVLLMRKPSSLSVDCRRLFGIKKKEKKKAHFPCFYYSYTVSSACGQNQQLWWRQNNVQECLGESQDDSSHLCLHLPTLTARNLSEPNLNAWMWAAAARGPFSKRLLPEAEDMWAQMLSALLRR